MQKRQSFVPPDGVRKAATRGLELHRRYGKGGSIGTIERAQRLAKGDEINIATARRMMDFFARAPEIGIAKSGEGPSAQRIDYLLWGGDEAVRWLESLMTAGPMEKASGKPIEVSVAKVDAELGIVFGYAIVCKIDGEDYFDTQGDHIPEDSMLEATAEYMAGDRVAKVMHRGEPAGQIVFGFPLTEEIAKAMDIEINKTGFVVGMKPSAAEILEKYRSGEFTGFSIGGSRQAETVVET